MNIARSHTLSVLRGITHELRRANPKMSPISKTYAYQYIIDEVRNHQVTEKRACKSSEELNIMAKTYLCYLQSLRQNQELLNRYHNKGERSVEETARLVGLQVPNKNPEDKNT
ncbi:hypothetical protein JTE90_020994 [Oedothorax gibbosus]|uniref:Protein FMC1 homolog n=1 Tax=Oedothorax gibbosus TaxID=931172 RepID=A0AAV6TZ48_9ARAC|nr:hypothetical protein JTE90_020994 [Oedothorax gibbosus]